MTTGAFFNPILAGGTSSSMNVDFIASTQSTEIGVGITFSNLSSPTPIFNYWTFGDGSFSTASNPNKTYLGGGSYSVALRAVDNASGGIEEKTNYIQIKNVYLLDLVPNAKCAYSVRKLRENYTGNCMRIIRSSDGASLNVGFVNDFLDTASISSFVGGGNAWVTDWYDQSGNNFTASQVGSPFGSGPRIVTGGTLQTSGGFAAPFWINAENMYLQNGLTMSQPITTFTVTNLSASTGINASIIYDEIQLSTNRAILIHSGTTETPNNTLRFGSTTLLTIETSTTGRRLTTVLHNAASSLARTQGVQRVSGNSNTGGFNGLRLGSLRGSPTPIDGNYAFSGWITEMIFYEANMSASFSVVEQNMNTYYSIY